MNRPSNTPKIDEILDAMLEGYIDPYVAKLPEAVTSIENTKKKAKAQLSAIFDTLIGKDEELDMGGSYEAVQRHNASYDRNKLRNEQRTRARDMGLDIEL